MKNISTINMTNNLQRIANVETASKIKPAQKIVIHILSRLLPAFNMWLLKSCELCRVYERLRR